MEAKKAVKCRVFTESSLDISDPELRWRKPFSNDRPLPPTQHFSQCVLLLLFMDGFISYLYVCFPFFLLFLRYFISLYFFVRAFECDMKVLFLLKCHERKFRLLRF